MVSAVIGTQWGDEGKAKVIDLLACKYDYVVRYQGGANAGHTVVIGNKKFIFHLLPSGLMNPNATVVIANGVVVDLQQLEEEIESLEALGFPTRSRVIISDKAHIVMEYHKIIDQLRESLSPKKIGTTARGIGPCYEDKIARKGIKICDLVNLSASQLAEKIKLVSQEKVFLIKNLYNYDYDFDPVKLAQECKEKFEKLGIRVENTEILLNEEIKRGKNILFEGAQGVLLDIDFGTYPYVTSSNASTNGVGSGAGVTRLDNVIGIVKAYTTRVGEGPFPTEQDNEIGEKLRARGDEFGATTGRPRRCGWLDIPLLRYSTIVANVNEIFLTKLDVLSEFEEIKVCVEYELNGEKMRIPRSMDPVTLYSIKPVYKTFKGWKTKISGVRTFRELPSEAKEYIKFIESEIGVPIKYISVGPSREQTIVL
jgi:adenylosuccinate synthase